MAAWLYVPTFRPATGRGPERLDHIHSVALDPHQPDVVYLATHNGLLRSTGEGWEVVGPPLDLMGFAPAPHRPGVLYASGHPPLDSRLPNPLGLMMSTDGGHRWQPVSLAGQADFHLIGIAPSRPQRFYAWNAGREPGLYRSDDGGRSWTRPAAAGLASSSRDVFDLAVHPDEPDTLLVATRQGLRLSRDGGESFTPLWGDAPVTAVAYGGGQLWAFLHHPEGGLVRSPDQGVSWFRVSSLRGADDPVISLAPHPVHGSIRYALTLQGWLLATRDGGRTWEVLLEEGRVVPRDGGGR